MRENYYDVSEADKRRRAPRRKKKGKRIALIVLAFLVIAVASFMLTIKLVDPTFDFKVLLPDSAAAAAERAEQFVYEKLLGKTPENPAAPQSSVQKNTDTTQTTTETTTRASGRYLPIEQFKFTDSLKGNYIGNLLGGGYVTADATFIYHCADGKGIYRFNPSTEDFTKIYPSSDKLRCLNVRGDFLYFINEDNGKLYKVSKGQHQAVSIAKNVRFAYVYDTTVYFVTTDNALCVMNTSELKKKTIYNAFDDELRFVGISKKRVYFTVTNFLGETEFLTIDAKGKQEVKEFRNKEKSDEVLSMMLEDGFLYYFAKGTSGYHLCRQKFGSERIVRLADDVNFTDYVIPAGNRVYYGELKDGRFNEKELNMNSEAEKVLLFVKNAEDSHTLVFQHGGGYDFIIGKKAENGKKVYIGSSMYTGSSNIMKFKDGAWKY